MSELQFAVFNLESVFVSQACANGDNRPNFDLCCWKAGISLLMERELKHSLGRATGPHYKQDERLHYAASEMVLAHPAAAIQHPEGPGTLRVQVSQPHCSENLTCSME